MLGAALCLVTEDTHGWEFIGRESIGGVTGLGLDNMKQLQTCTKCFCKTGGHFNHNWGGIREINCDNNIFHSIYK